jgi:hypothetical protein
VPGAELEAVAAVELVLGVALVEEQTAVQNQICWWTKA